MTCKTLSIPSGLHGPVRDTHRTRKGHEGRWKGTWLTFMAWRARAFFPPLLKARYGNHTLSSAWYRVFLNNSHLQESIDEMSQTPPGYSLFTPEDWNLAFNYFVYKIPSAFWLMSAPQLSLASGLRRNGTQIAHSALPSVFCVFPCDISSTAAHIVKGSCSTFFLPSLVFKRKTKFASPQDVQNLGGWRKSEDQMYFTSFVSLTDGQLSTHEFSTSIRKFEPKPWGKWAWDIFIFFMSSGRRKINFCPYAFNHSIWCKCLEIISKVHAKINLLSQHTNRGSLTAWLRDVDLSGMDALLARRPATVYADSSILPVAYELHFLIHISSHF